MANKKKPQNTKPKTVVKGRRTSNVLPAKDVRKLVDIIIREVKREHKYCPMRDCEIAEIASAEIGRRISKHATTYHRKNLGLPEWSRRRKIPKV